MNNIIISFYSIIFLLTTQDVNGQSEKNAISIFYTPQITRTYFDNTFNSILKPFTEFYETTKNFRPIIGNSYGIDFTRKHKSQ